MGKTIISWATHTWTPVTGCSKVDEECVRCYAETLSLKRGWSELPWTEKNSAANVILHPDRLRAPKAYPPGSRVFVTSMGDIFHKQVPDAFLREVFAVMNSRPDLRFMVLTKRAERMADWPGPWGPHIWAGTTVGHRGKLALQRLEDLRRTPARIRFVSAEPMLEDLGEIDLTGIHQVLVGGESGPGYRPLNMAWARSLRDRCVDAGVAYFQKQDAAYRTETRPWLIEEDGTAWEWKQWPDQLNPPVQVFPPKRKEPFRILHA